VADDELQRVKAELDAMRRAADLAKVSSWDFDLATGAINWSPGCRELFGVGPDEVITRALHHSFYTPDEARRLMELIRVATEHGEPYVFHSRIYPRHGHPRDITSRAAPVRDAAGRVTGYHGVVIDVTETRAQDSQVRRLAAVAARTDNGVVVANREGLIEWVNDGFTRLTEWTLEDVVGRRPGSFLQGPLTDPSTVAFMRERLAKFEGFHTEVLNYTKSGRPYWVDINVKPLHDEHGVVTHLMAIEKDISERKAWEASQTEARHQLEQSLSMLNVVLDSTEHAVIATDARGVVTLFNRGAETMLGWSAAEVVGHHTPALIHDPLEVEAHAAQLTNSLGAPISPGFDAFVELARRGGSETREWTYVRKDRSRLSVSLTVTALRGADGSVLGFLGVASDITARRARDLASRALIERLEKLSRHLPGVVYQYHLMPDGRSCFPWASDGLRSIYGVAPAEVREDASPVFAAIHTEDLERVAASITTSAQDLTQWKDEYRVWRDGRVRWVMGNATPERLTDGSTLWHGYISDITERKAFEAELVRARQEALEASRVKSQFLANMSHEIRTPLNGILGMTQLMLEATPHGEQRELLDAVHVSGQTLLALINDILDLSKVESGRLELERVSFSPRDVLQRAVQTAEVRAKQKGLPVHLELDPELPRLVMGDPTRTYQVLVNLVGNAVKFTERGEVRVVARRGERGLRVEVRDTGIGIAAEQLPRVFEAFRQGDGSITRRYGGTGLGLAISRKLSEAMGGVLSVTSRDGEGSCFVAELPLVEATKDLPPRPSADVGPTAHRPLLVLMAEDNAINALVVRKLLEREGHGVVHVTSGVGAVEATSRQAFDLVLMDMQMPELDGLEATRQIRERERRLGGHLPICALTANAMKGDIERCHQAGMDDYLTKPVELAVLRRKLRHLSQREATVSRAG
jgi:PAS domain S-box-containing protein